jgi:TatD DNase family protein
MSPTERKNWRLYDTHAHLTDSVYAGCLEQVVADSRAAGLVAINVVGFDRVSSQAACDLATSVPDFFYSTVGIQPNSAGDSAAGDWDTIETLAGHPTVRGIGETGLDRYWQDTPWNVQCDFFDRHIELGRARGLPLVIHMRECGQELVERLRPHAARGSLRGVMHSYTGDWSVCKKCLDFGLMISFAGMITFKKSDDLRKVAQQVPEDRLLIETDSPYLSPEPFRGKRPNVPARVEHTLRCLADIRGQSPAELAAATTANAFALFSSSSPGLTATP